MAGSPLKEFGRGLSPSVTASATAATAVSARSAVAATALAATVATRFATVTTVLAAVAVRLFPAFARLALVAAFARRAAFAGWGTLGGCVAHCLVSFGHGSPAGEAHAALFIHSQALDPNLIA